ncbi:peptide-methionine (S)-S-oxide reductase MsrA [Negadavirga shengliensis]|uniref:Peptide methionine sulfoxide reductase MsrA n=1 Tax=Negadavirga shengliensis TaxID=1389218 RepID=A0ABV9T5D6_9BACT
MELPKTDVEVPEGKEVATLGAGCFWCTEAIFQQLRGVEKVRSGFSGGHRVSPAYKEVVTGTTGHAEVIQMIYDPTIISFEDLLEIFWTSHDPTTLNRQGGDVGPQYRSVIFYHSMEQKEIAEAFMDKLEHEKIFDSPVVTEITAFSNFYPAEDYHSNYFELHGSEPYCQFVIKPKVEKFRKFFKDRIRS